MKQIYRGSDIAEFNRLRDLLDARNIPYKYHVRDTETGWIDFLIGFSARAFRGSRGPAECSKQYSIWIREKDYKAYTDGS